MSSQPLFKEPRAIKTPYKPLVWANESTPRKNSAENQKELSAVLSHLNSSRKHESIRKEDIPSPFFLIKNLTSRSEEKLQKQTYLKTIGEKDSTKQRIRLPSLIPVKRVVTTNPIDVLGSNDLKEKKLLRRRLNSEDEKSLISFSKMEIIFGGKDKKISLNEGFQNPRKYRTERQSQVIYDGIASAKRKTSGRKKSEDLGVRIRTKLSGDLMELRNRSENGIRKQQKEISLLSLPIQHKNNRLLKKQNNSLKMIFNEPNRGRKRTCKESDHAYDVEQENTKGSSFNTDKGTKELNWMNHILGDSENEGNSQNELRSKQNTSNLDYLSQGNSKSIKGNKLKELSKQKLLENEAMKSISKRKSSFASLRRESILIEKSDNENISEYIGQDSYLGSAYRRIPLHLNIGSQISEESEMESDLEIENINVWTQKGDEGGSSELQWEIRVMDLLEKQKNIFRSRKNSEVITDTQTSSNIFYYMFVLYLITNKI